MVRLGEYMEESIEAAVSNGDLVKLRKLLEAGADPNFVTEDGDSLLMLACTAWETNHNPVETVRLLLEAGADPNHVIDGCNPIVTAIFAEQPKVVELLLLHGADPNAIVEGRETIYELAEFDYRYEQYNLHLPETPTEQDEADEDAWVAMLDRFATKYGKRHPEELLALRRYGAKTTRELAAVKP